MAFLTEAKRGFDTVQAPQLRRTYSPKRMASIFILACMAVISGLPWLWRFLPAAGPSVGRPEAHELFRWDNIIPSKTLQYTPCFGQFQCARLEVPLDWNETTSGDSDKVAIAILKKPAIVDVTDPRYGGVILFNPGGPGGSGTDSMRQTGEALQIIVDSQGPDEEKHFDVLSWDPRGVGSTTPRHGCISNQVARQIWTSQREAIGISLQDPEVFTNVFSRTRTFGQICANSAEKPGLNKRNGKERIARYMSTANVVRDMVEIIERHGEWRSKRAASLLSHHCSSKTEAPTILARAAYRKGEEKLQYWGFSYGTLLGQTFASMQPHRVGRMVLDGVVDAADYTRNDWLHNIQDTDRITALFAAKCYAAGPTRCSFHSNSASAITSKLHTLLSTIQASPLPAFHNGVPYTITHSDVVILLFGLWYNPTLGFTVAANVLHGLANGDGTFLALIKSSALSSTCSRPSADEYDQEAATLAILCTDAARPANTTAAFQAHLDKLRSQSEMFANHWATTPLACTTFSQIVRAQWRFEGPFGANTSHPILFLSQSLDPVTPLRNAAKATTLFPGSALVEIRGAGHCSIAMPSVQGMLAVRRYFARGDVPTNGTRYEVDVGFFGDVGGNGTAERTGWEGRVLEAGRQIASGWPSWEAGILQSGGRTGRMSREMGGIRGGAGLI